jgi:hypothetical protein
MISSGFICARSLLLRSLFYRLLNADLKPINQQNDQPLSVSHLIRSDVPD